MREEWTPQRMRDLRRRLDLNQRQFAEALRITDRHLRRCLSGAAAISEFVASGLERLEADARGECTRACARQCGGEGEDVHRRHLLGTVGLAVLGLPELGAEAVGARLYRMYATAPPGALVLHARMHASLHPSPDAYGFVGFLARMANSGEESHSAFTQARDLAFESGDRRAQAQALLGLSTALRGTSAALPMVEQARALAADADPWTRFWAELVLAIEHAHRGRDHAGACHGALWRAERLLGATDPQAADGFYAPAGLFAGWGGASLASETARCEVLLGDGRRALQALDDVHVPVVGDSTDRGATLVVIRRGGALRLTGEPDAAAAALAQGWRRAKATGHGLAKGLVLEQRALFDPKQAGISEVRALDELICG